MAENKLTNTGFSSQAQREGGAQFTKSAGGDEKEQSINKKIDEALKNFDVYMKEYVETFLKEWMAYSGFTEKKITDTPKEALAVVNRAFVTMSGTTSQRPTSSAVQGQYYFDTTLDIPIWRNGSDWVDATGTPV
jgi:hypothetical protein